MTPRCPICRKPSEAASRPFCSGRCADVDLHRWLSGRYAIPAAPDDEEAAIGEGAEGQAPGPGASGQPPGRRL